MKLWGVVGRVVGSLGDFSFDLLLRLRGRWCLEKEKHLLLLLLLFFETVDRSQVVVLFDNGVRIVVSHVIVFYYHWRWTIDHFTRFFLVMGFGAGENHCGLECYYCGTSSGSRCCSRRHVVVGARRRRGGRRSQGCLRHGSGWWTTPVLLCTTVLLLVFLGFLVLCGVERRTVYHYFCSPLVVAFIYETSEAALCELHSTWRKRYASVTGRQARYYAKECT